MSGDPHGDRVDGGSSNVRFILRNGRGELFGVYPRNAQAALSAAPLMLKLAVDNPFRGVDLFETEDGGLITSGGLSSRMSSRVGSGPAMKLTARR